MIVRHTTPLSQAKAFPSPDGSAACVKLKALLDRVSVDDLPLRRRLRPLIDLSIECGRRGAK